MPFLATNRKTAPTGLSAGASPRKGCSAETHWKEPQKRRAAQDRRALLPRPLTGASCSRSLPRAFRGLPPTPGPPELRQDQRRRGSSRISLDRATILHAMIISCRRAWVPQQGRHGRCKELKSHVVEHDAKAIVCSPAGHRGEEVTLVKFGSTPSFCQYHLAAQTTYCQPSAHHRCFWRG